MVRNPTGWPSAGSAKNDGAVEAAPTMSDAPDESPDVVDEDDGTRDDR
jgi:hypothetical protein